MSEVNALASEICQRTHSMPYRQPCWACCQAAQGSPVTNSQSALTALITKYESRAAGESARYVLAVDVADDLRSLLRGRGQ